MSTGTTKDDKNTPSPQSEVSFWAHTSSVEAYCNQFDKTVLDGPLPKWWFRSLYTDAPTTFSGPTPPRKKRHREDLKEFSPASARPSPKKRRFLKDLSPEEFSPTSSPCEMLIQR